MPSSKPIRVLIVDDHRIVRDGLATLIETCDGLVLAGTAANGEEAVALCQQTAPDVVLIDLMMPVMDGVTAIRAIKQTHPAIQIIALTSFNERGMVRKALEAGALSYLLKNVSREELAEAIYAAARGESVLSPEATQALVQSLVEPPDHQTGLTARELEVLALMVEGQRDSDIAERLAISLSTVKFHVRSVLAKLDVSTRTEAVAVALRRNLIE